MAGLFNPQTPFIPTSMRMIYDFLVVRKGKTPVKILRVLQHVSFQLIEIDRSRNRMQCPKKSATCISCRIPQLRRPPYTAAFLPLTVFQSRYKDYLDSRFVVVLPIGSGACRAPGNAPTREPRQILPPRWNAL